MAFTPQIERELHHSMLIGLIQALHHTQQLTDAQVQQLLSDPKLKEEDETPSA